MQFCRSSWFDNSSLYLVRSFCNQIFALTTDKKPKTKKRKQYIIWYNLPFSNSVKTNIGREPTNLVKKKHFVKNNPLSKMFNKHDMQIGYSCMANFKILYESHNQNVLNKNN